MIAAGGAIEVTQAAGLAKAVDCWLDDPAALQAARVAATGFCAQQAVALEAAVETLLQELHLESLDG